MKPILTDLYQKWMSDGELFTMMGIRHVTPWAEETDGKAIDLEYFGNRSGSKIVAPLLEKMLTDTGLSVEAKQNIVDLIWIRFGRNWGKLWKTLTVEYNPIENYRMTENGKINHGGDQNNGVYGFNSTDAVPSGKGHDEYIDITELTRSGNIGVTTSQQMIQSERDLWVWKFFEQVFQDVDTVLSIDVYGQSCLGDFSEYHGGGSEYVLPPATASTLGGIKVGDHLIITPDGTLSAEGCGESLVTSVNGKTGAVVLNYDDVGSPSIQDVPFRFGVDADGNYGYYKAGADTVTPFLTGGGEGHKVFTGRFTAGASLEIGDTVNHIYAFAYMGIGYPVRNTSFMLFSSEEFNTTVNVYTDTANKVAWTEHYYNLLNATPTRGALTSPSYVGVSSDGVISSIITGGSTSSGGLASGLNYVIMIEYD